MGYEAPSGLQILSCPDAEKLATGQEAETPEVSRLPVPGGWKSEVEAGWGGFPLRPLSWAPRRLFSLRLCV